MTRKKKEIDNRTPEEKLQDDLNRELKRLREDYYLIPEPTYMFNVGDEVSIGNLRDCKVEEVVDGGKIYLINFTNYNHNYGNPILTPNTKQYWAWLDVRKKNNNTTSFIKNRELRLNYMQMQISSIFSKVYYFGVDFEPEYQRDYVWNLEDKISLIDSIFNGIDIGKFVFIKRGILDPYEILDGKQRITALKDFYEDKFKYNGVYFSDLSKGDQNYIENYAVSIAEIDNIDKETTLRYFLKLNTCGKVMDKEHLDNVRKMLEVK